MNKDARFNKWNRWLETIYNDVQGLLVNHYIYQEVQQIIRSNLNIQIESSFYDWMRNVYADSLVIGVRRHLDTDKRSISFARLLGEIRDDPEIVSRERYVALYEEDGLPKDVANRDFDRLAGVGSLHVNSAAIGTDLLTLTQKAESIGKYATKRIAHLDRFFSKYPATYAELDECLDYLEELLKRYLKLLRGSHYERIVPVWQYDWKRIFQHPWIEEGRPGRSGPDPD